jgi:glycosyltransferase involved in cell wall biosynthesis
LESNPFSIDVVIPAYNAEKFITETLRSVGAQDVPIRSVIIVNDGSEDNTEARVLDFQKVATHLKINLINQSNHGLSAARNIGISHAKADYIALLDADDLWSPHKLSSQIQLFQAAENPNLGLVYCAYERMNEGGKILDSGPKGVIAPKLRGKVYKSLLRGNFISGSGSSVLIKRTVFDSVGLFDENLKACEDWDMWLRIAKHYQFDYVDKSLVLIRIHQNNMQKDAMRMITAELMMLNKFIQRGEKNPFLLWKLRTYLYNKGVSATSINGFSKCEPILQEQLSGWRMNLASLLLSPAKNLAGLYLRNK